MTGKKTRLILLAVLLILLFPHAGKAAETELTLGLDELENIFSTVILENSPLPRENLRIANFNARPISLTLPPGTMEYKVIQKSEDGRPGRKTVTAAILVDGKEEGQIRMNGDLQLFADVVCTTKRMGRNDIISADAVTVLRQDISMLDTGIIHDPAQAIGQKLKTSLRAGSVLYSQLVEAPPLVNRGELVTIRAKSKAVQITAPGEAKNAGALGEMVKVKNLMSRREIFARVAGPGLVETEF